MTVKYALTENDFKCFLFCFIFLIVLCFFFTVARDIQLEAAEWPLFLLLLLFPAWEKMMDYSIPKNSV